VGGDEDAAVDEGGERGGAGGGEDFCDEGESFGGGEGGGWWGLVGCWEDARVEMEKRRARARTGVVPGS